LLPQLKESGMTKKNELKNLRNFLERCRSKREANKSYKAKIIRKILRKKR